MVYVSPLSFILLLLLHTSSPSSSSSSSEEDQTATSIRSTRLLDLTIRDYTVKLLEKGNTKTGVQSNVHLPLNLSGIDVQTVRFRCGSLRRYGGRIDEFHLGIGVTINPFVERVLLIKQEIRFNWLNIYNLDGYELITPLLGLLAYNDPGSDSGPSPGPRPGHDQDQDPFEIEIIASEMSPIRVYFTNVTKVKSKDLSGKMPYCAYFGGGDGKVSLESMVAPYVCEGKRLGHFGLVIEDEGLMYAKKMSRWKVALASSIGAALGAFLLGLLFIAMCVKAKKRSKLEEMVRRAYEEEALQVSMVGHVIAPSPSL